MTLRENLSNLFKYRWLLQLLVERDLKVKYRRSVLGYFWSILNPLLMMIILTIVFSTVFRFDIPNYPVYLLAGQLIYSFFCGSYKHGVGGDFRWSSIDKKGLFTQIHFSIIKSIVIFYQYIAFIMCIIFCHDNNRCRISSYVIIVTIGYDIYSYI